MSYEVRDNTVVFSVARGAERMALSNEYKPAAKPTSTKIKPYMKMANWLTPWGDDNFWPITVMNALKPCAPAQVCIEILTTLFYGNGLKVYEEGPDGSITTALLTPEQKEWFRAVNIDEYLMRAATDYFTYGNQFCEIIRNAKGDGVGYLNSISAPFCRLGKIDENTGKISEVMVYGSWENLPAYEATARLPLLPRMDAAESFKSATSAKFVWHVGNYTPGSLSYHDCPWHALVRNGTLDIFPEIPKIRKNRVKNAMFIKYHVRINEVFWWLRFGGMEAGKAAWEGMTTDQRQTERQKFFEQIDKKLAGSDNAFKSLFSGTFITPNGTEVKLMTIEKLEAEAGESAAFDPDKMSGVADIFLGFGIPSAVANTVLSDSKSRGGGSDIREGNSLVLTRMPMHRANLLKPVDFAMRLTNIAGKPLLAPNQFLGMENTILTTLDQSSTGTQNVNPQNPAA